MAHKDDHDQSPTWSGRNEARTILQRVDLIPCLLDHEYCTRTSVGRCISGQKLPDVEPSFESCKHGAIYLRYVLRVPYVYSDDPPVRMTLYVYIVHTPLFMLGRVPFGIANFVPRTVE